MANTIVVAGLTLKTSEVVKEINALARQVRRGAKIFLKVDAEDFIQCAWEYLLGDFSRKATNYDSDRDLWSYFATSFHNYMVDDVPRRLLGVSATRPRYNDSQYAKAQKIGALGFAMDDLDDPDFKGHEKLATPYRCDPLELLMSSQESEVLSFMAQHTPVLYQKRILGVAHPHDVMVRGVCLGPEERTTQAVSEVEALIKRFGQDLEPEYIIELIDDVETEFKKWRGARGPYKPRASAQAGA